MLRGPTAFYVIALQLTTSLDEALATSTGGRPERACVVPGEIAWDDCQCGMLAVTPRSWALSDTFPDDADSRGSLRSSPCDLPWLVSTINVQLVRCAPSPNGNALSVPCTALDAASQILISDAYVVVTETTSLFCTMKNDDEIVDYIISDVATIGPSGGCVGVELQVSVAVDR